MFIYLFKEKLIDKKPKNNLLIDNYCQKTILRRLERKRRNLIRNICLFYIEIQLKKEIFSWYYLFNLIVEI